MRSRLLAVCVAVSLLAAGAAAAEVVVDWNNVALNAIRTDRTSPPKASRALAMVHVAVFDAVDGIVGGYTPYHVTDAAPVGASPEAAAVAAAHNVLVALYPAQQATFDAARATSLAAIPDGSAKTSGIGWGEAVAAEILALRSGDHSGDASAYEAPVGASWWLPTPPAFAPPLLPNWPTVTPWALHHGSQLRPPAPPAPNTGEHTLAFEEVELLGKSDSAVRTAEQTQIALFWADGSGTVTPPGHWNVIAQGLAAQHQLSLLQRARLFALLNIAVADAAIVSWDTKYAYSYWRPVTGIQHAGEDGNPATRPDPTWLPLLATPPFPSYSSGHSTFSAASSRVLAQLLRRRRRLVLHHLGRPAGRDAQLHQLLAGGRGGRPEPHLRRHPLAVRQPGGAQRAAATSATSSPSPSSRRWWRRAPARRMRPRSASTTAASRCRRAGAPTRSSGPASVVSQTGDSGQLYFFDPDNTELTVKVLDACGVNDRYWVFASGLTNVEVLITVTDTQAGRVRQYFNPRGRAFAPVQDISAFATCP